MVLYHKPRELSVYGDLLDELEAAKIPFCIRTHNNDGSKEYIMLVKCNGVHRVRTRGVKLYHTILKVPYSTAISSTDEEHFISPGDEIWSSNSAKAVRQLFLNECSAIIDKLQAERKKKDIQRLEDEIDEL